MFRLRVSSRQWLTLVIALIAVSLFAYAAFPSQSRIESRVQSIAATYGVRVYYMYDRDQFFPASWLEAPISAEGAQIALGEVERILGVIDQFLGAYPPRVIERDLQSIYLVSMLRFYGKDYGATNSRDALYIRSENYESSFILSRLFSEMSSIVMRNYDFPDSAWAAINPAGFNYVGSGRAVLGRDNLWDQSTSLFAQGFLYEYSKSSMENDFNLISDWLFTQRAKLWQLIQQYPLLRAKVELAIGFYQAVDSDFDFGSLPPASSGSTDAGTSDSGTQSGRRED